MRAAANCHPDRPLEAKGLCKSCYVAAWNKAHRAEVTGTERLRRQANSARYREVDQRRRQTPKRKASLQTYRANNRAYFAAAQRLYRARNPEIVKARWARWYAANPEKVRTKRQLRDQHKRAARLGVESSLTREEWATIKEAFDHCCAYCGQPFDRLTQDHVIPLSKGGKHVAANIVPACRPCNSRKGNRLQST